MTRDDSVHHRTRQFILKRFPLASKRGLRDEDPILRNGIMDSLGVLELVAFLEETFDIRIDDDDLTPENFESIDHVAAFVTSKRAGPSATERGG